MADAALWEEVETALPLTVILCLTYLVASAPELLQTVGVLDEGPLMPDVMDAIIMLVIAAVFATGAKHLRRDDGAGVAFLMAGVVLATIVFILRGIVLLSNLLGAVLGLEGWLDWTVSQDLRVSMLAYAVVAISVGGVLLADRLGRGRRPQHEEGVSER